jgi:predicted pyridoxine 5'-phosphate oxidase superfamily flavin-nucleotide-binding protein
MAASLPFSLTPEISALVSGAFETGNVLLLAAVSSDGKPLLSFRGSTAVFGDSQLSFWARNAVGETIVAIRQNPHVALMYRSQSVPLLQFIGRARISDNVNEQDRAFNLAHEKEREKDPERKGLAVIVDLDEVNGVLGFNSGKPIVVHLTRG